MKTDLSFLDFIERIVKGDLSPIRGIISLLEGVPSTSRVHLEDDFDYDNFQSIIKEIDLIGGCHPFYISFHKCIWTLIKQDKTIQMEFLPALLEERDNLYLYSTRLTDIDGNYLLFMLAEKAKALLEIESRFAQSESENDFRFLVNKIHVRLWGYLHDIHCTMSQLRVHLPPPSSIIKPLDDPNSEFIRHKHYVFTQLKRVIIRLMYDVSFSYGQFLDKNYKSVQDISQQLMSSYGASHIKLDDFSPDYLLNYYPLYSKVDMSIFDEVQNQISEVLAIVNSGIPSIHQRESISKLAEGIVALENIKFQALFAVDSGNIDDTEPYNNDLLNKWYSFFLEKHKQEIIKKIADHQLILYLNDLQLLLKRYISVDYSDLFLQNAHPSLLRKALKLVDEQILAYHSKPDLFFPKLTVHGLHSLKWSKDKVDFVELVAALHLTNSVIRKDGTELSMEGLYESLKEVFDVEVSDFHKKLHEARNRKKSKTILIDEMKKAFEENSDPGDPLNSKSRVRK